MSLLTDDELLALAAAAKASGPKDDRTMDRIISWANRASADAAVLDLAIEGRVILDWDPVGDQIRVKLTRPNIGAGRTRESSPGVSEKLRPQATAAFPSDPAWAHIQAFVEALVGGEEIVIDDGP